MSVAEATRPEAEKATRPVRRRNRYTKDFQKDAARLVIEQQRTITDVAHEFRISQQTLGNWVRRERQIHRSRHEVPAVAVAPISGPSGREAELLRMLAARDEELEAMKRVVVLLARDAS